MTKQVFAGVIVALLACSASAQLPKRLNLKLDASEAEAVLTILDKRSQHEDVTDADWQKVFRLRNIAGLYAHEWNRLQKRPRL